MKMIEGHEEIMKAYRREVPIKITTAKELGKDQMEIIITIINKIVSADEQPKLSVAVDPGILGGFIVEIGDKTIDLSVATRLNSIEQSLQESIYQQ